MSKTNVLIMGAAGRDFHNYNTIYRDNDKYNVFAFTATQIPNIEGRCYPSELAGALYPDGIPIYSEIELVNLIKKFNIDEVVFSYSDVCCVLSWPASALSWQTSSKARPHLNSSSLHGPFAPPPPKSIIRL